MKPFTIRNGTRVEFTEITLGLRFASSAGDLLPGRAARNQVCADGFNPVALSIGQTWHDDSHTKKNEVKHYHKPVPIRGQTTVRKLTTFARPAIIESAADAVLSRFVPVACTLLKAFRHRQL